MNLQINVQLHVRIKMLTLRKVIKAMSVKLDEEAEDDLDRVENWDNNENEEKGRI